MKVLPSGCSYTDVWVSPVNWASNAAKNSLNKPWYVQCVFYDPQFKEKYPKGFQFRKKLNKFKTLDARRSAVQFMLDEIPRLIEDRGYNPITKTFIELAAPEPQPKAIPLSDELTPATPFLEALEFARKSIIVVKSTADDIKYLLPKFAAAATVLEFDKLPISEVKRKHIRFTLDQLKKTEKTFSDHKFNKYRGYISILYKELMEFEVVEDNVVADIKKRVHVSNIREVMTPDQRVKVNAYLRDTFPDFWRFTLLFFHSGGRITELLNLKVDDVFLVNQKYRVLIRKGNQNKWVERVIKDIAVPIWIKSLYNAKKGDYVFSRGLVPGPDRIRREQISRRWKMHVKDKFDVTADFYALKHLNIDETAALLSISDAAAMASHTSTKMVQTVYAVGEKSRQNERLRKIDNKFA